MAEPSVAETPGLIVVAALARQITAAPPKSLIDNYEWTLGYASGFGLMHVDFDCLQLTPKASYHALAAALAR